jgi:hypothetical protein
MHRISPTLVLQPANTFINIVLQLYFGKAHFVFLTCRKCQCADYHYADCHYAQSCFAEYYYAQSHCAECRYAKSRYTDRHYAQSRYAKCHSLCINYHICCKMKDKTFSIRAFNSKGRNYKQTLIKEGIKGYTIIDDRIVN